jgi:hypothetical protein
VDAFGGYAQLFVQFSIRGVDWQFGRTDLSPDKLKLIRRMVPLLEIEVSTLGLCLDYDKCRSDMSIRLHT